MERRRLLQYIADHPNLTVTQAVTSYLKLYPFRAIPMIVEMLEEKDDRREKN